MDVGSDNESKSQYTPESSGINRATLQRMEMHEASPGSHAHVPKALVMVDKQTRNALKREYDLANKMKWSKPSQKYFDLAHMAIVKVAHHEGYRIQRKKV